MKISIITAMESEFNAIHQLYNFDVDNCATAYGQQIELIQSGMGKVNAAIATTKACLKGADIVINTGLAGGIDASLKQGDIVIANRVCYHDVWCGEPNQIGQVQNLPLMYEADSILINHIHQHQPEYKLGLTVTGDQFLTDINRLKEIKNTFPQALAVDMESAAVAQTCYLNHTRYISLRIISDVVGTSSQQEQYQNFWQTVPNKASQMVDDVLSLISNLK